MTDKAVINTIVALRDKRLGAIISAVQDKHGIKLSRVQVSIILRANSKADEPEPPQASPVSGRLRMTSVGAYNHCQWPLDCGSKCRKPIEGIRVACVQNYCQEHQLRALRPEARAVAERAFRKHGA